MWLSKTSKELESAFLRTSKEMEQLATAADRVLSGARILMQFSLGEGEGQALFAQSSQSILGPIEFSVASLKDARQIAGKLNELQRLTKELIAGVSVFERVSGSVAIVQVMLRIECASLPPEAQAPLLSLGEEIQSLRTRLAEMVSQEFDRIRETARVLGQVQQRLERIQAGQAESEKRRRAIETTLGNLRRDIESNRSHQPLVEETTALQGAVGRVIQGLQFQDIVNQRISHIDHALSEMGARLGNTREAPAGFARAAALEAAQVGGETTSSLKTALGQVESGLDELAAVVERVDRWCVALPEVKASAAAIDGMVQTLLEAMGEAGALAHSLDAEIAETHEVLRPASELATSFTKVIAQVSYQIRLIALNAQVQAAQVSAGTGLEVLAAALCGIADDTENQARALGSDTDRLSEALVAEIHASEALRARSGKMRRQFQDEAPLRQADLEQFRRDSVMKLSRTLDELAHVKQLSDQARRSVPVARFYGDRFGEAASGAGRRERRGGLCANRAEASAGSRPRGAAVSGEVARLHDGIRTGRTQARSRGRARESSACGSRNTNRGVVLGEANGQDDHDRGRRRHHAQADLIHLARRRPSGGGGRGRAGCAGRSEGQEGRHDHHGCEYAAYGRHRAGAKVAGSCRIPQHADCSAHDGIGSRKEESRPRGGGYGMDRQAL